MTKPSGKYAILGEQHDILVGGYTIVGNEGDEPDDGLAFFAYREDAEAVIKMFNGHLNLKKRVAELEELLEPMTHTTAGD